MAIEGEDGKSVFLAANVLVPSYTPTFWR